LTLLQDLFASEYCCIRDAVSHRTGLARHDYIWSGGANVTRDQIAAV
jgi:hypothetical protein